MTGASVSGREPPAYVPVRCALVTGAGGFIGRVLGERLRGEGAEVVALMRRARDGPWRRTVVADIARDEIPPEALAGVDTVFHLAAKVHALSERGADEAEYWRTNVEGTRAVLEAARAGAVKRLVFFSSVKAMGEGGPACLDEGAPEAPASAYGRSKLAAERLVREAASGGRLHAAVLRLPLVYGSGASGNLARMLDAVARGRFPPVAEPGNKRSVVHVRDVVEAALLAASHPRAASQIYIVTDGSAYSTRELYVHMCRALGRPVPRWSVPAGWLRPLALLGDGLGRVRGRRLAFDSDALEKLTGSAWYSSAKIERELGFRAGLDLERGLAEMVEALRAAA